MRLISLLGDAEMCLPGNPVPIKSARNSHLLLPPKARRRRDSGIVTDVG